MCRSIVALDPVSGFWEQSDSPTKMICLIVEAASYSLQTLWIYNLTWAVRLSYRLPVSQWIWCFGLTPTHNSNIALLDVVKSRRPRPRMNSTARFKHGLRERTGSRSARTR